MDYQTFADIKTKVEVELDIEVEEFIQPDEFRKYVNAGIAVAEAAIHKLGLEDEYFLTKAYLPLTTGQEDVALPTNIYSNKIRAVIYRNGTTIYPIRRLRAKDKFADLEESNLQSNASDWYSYLLRNDSANAGVVMELTPPSRETSTQNVKLWFIRKANKWTVLANDNELCDLPEIAMEFLYQYVKYRCYEKEGHPNAADAKADLKELQSLMIQTLEQMVQDDDTEVIKDLSHYEDMS